MSLPTLDVLLRRGAGADLDSSKASWQWLADAPTHLLGPGPAPSPPGSASSPLGRALRGRGGALEIVGELEARAQEANEARAARERRAQQILRPPVTKTKLAAKTAKVAPAPSASAGGADDGDATSPRPARLPLQYVLPPQEAPHFPSLDAVSPRTRRKLTRLPKPSQQELDKVRRGPSVLLS